MRSISGLEKSAQEVRDSDVRRQFEEVAQHWLYLAEQAERLDQ